MKKKILILISIFILVIIGISLALYNYTITEINSNQKNKEFDKLNSEIYGTELISLINKATNNNESFNIKKNNENKYINDNKNSIKIDVKFLEKEELIDMESINNLGFEQFIKYYSKTKFKCTKVDYHSKTKQICYLKFEEI